MQFQSDILSIPVIRPRIIETTALGAAYLAGLATGYWDSVEEIKQQWQEERKFTGTMNVIMAEKLKARWVEAVKRAGGWIP